MERTKVKGKTVPTEFGYRFMFEEPVNVRNGDSIAIIYTVGNEIECYIERKEKADEEKP